MKNNTSHRVRSNQFNFLGLLGNVKMVKSVIKSLLTFHTVIRTEFLSSCDFFHLTSAFGIAHLPTRDAYRQLLIFLLVSMILNLTASRSCDIG